VYKRQALILSGVLMLRHIGRPDVADRVETALRDVIAEGAAITADLGGNAGTSEFADAIIDRLAASPTLPPPGQAAPPSAASNPTAPAAAV